MKKKPRSLQPSEGRMRKRAQEARALPVEAQAAFYYCGGRNKAEFTSAVAAGVEECVELALDVVAGELWLCPRDGVRYARSIRAALRKACESALLNDRQKRVLLSILVHAPGDVLPAAAWLNSRPPHPYETLCYFFGWKSFSYARWQVAPWGELGKECGLVLAADGSFYRAVSEWDGYYGASR